MNEKKILIFSIAYIPFVGGAELAVKEITDRLGDNFEFHLITNRFERKVAKEEKIGNVKVYRVGLALGRKNKTLRQFSNFVFIAFGFWKAIFLNFRNKYDMTWSIMAAYAGAIGLFFKIFYPKIPWILTLQDGDSPEYMKARLGEGRASLWRYVFVGWYRIPIWRLLFRLPSHITAISNFLVQWAKENGLTSSIEIVPNGVDIQKFKSQISNLKSDELKRELKIREGGKILITTSRLVEKNAIGDVIEAMKYLPDNVKFLILGSGPLENELKSLVARYALRGRVFFLGHIEPQEVPKYLAISDIFVRPSLSEGLGSSFLEAMAAGVPVVATPVGGIPDFLFDPSFPRSDLENSKRSDLKQTGLFCEVHNSKSIAEKIITLLKNNELREKIIANAKEMVLRDYDWNLVAEKMKNIFEKI